MNDSVYRTRSLGVAATGLPDQYADGKAATVWNIYVGSTQARTKLYRESVCDILRSHGCQHVLDVACGTGVDSIMLLENGFRVSSIDASDKMLKYAQKTRWARRKEDAFDNWVIEEGNWLTLLETEIDFPSEGFDAVVCLGNSFAHLPDFDGTNGQQRLALRNFCDALKPGGILLIDHRNYDAIIDTGIAPPGANIYYNSPYVDNIKTSVLRVDGKPSMVTLDYHLQVPLRLVKKRSHRGHVIAASSGTEDEDEAKVASHFRLSYHPHRLDDFKRLVSESFSESFESDEVLGDFQDFSKVATPAYFVHVVRKKENPDASSEPESKRKMSF
ncbi:glycine N-methyltransferase-like [Sycon ciliatum]|uniref:glycine N-methyltransferase-like n=1 Tax=Sycon ciliatum TaxID=27933 RepID=UPI0020AA3BA2|eukprot:scpid57958/ scgid7660/ Glycine N-methyltransferase; Folate-binding protein